MLRTCVGACRRSYSNNTVRGSKKADGLLGHSIRPCRMLFASSVHLHPRQRPTVPSRRDVDASLVHPADTTKTVRDYKEPLRPENVPSDHHMHVGNGSEDEAFESELTDKLQMGRRSLGTLELPDELKRSIANIIGKQTSSRLREDSMRLAHHLFTRTSRSKITAPDIAEARAAEARIRLVEELMETHELSKVPMTELWGTRFIIAPQSQAQKIIAQEQARKDVEALPAKRPGKVVVNVEKQVLVPHTMRYGMREALAYLTSRSPGVFGAMFRALFEIVDIDGDWKPRSVLDFGSGTGMGLWAVNELWYTPLARITAVDLAEAMLELNAALLIDPETGKTVDHLRNVDYKRYLPIGAKEEPYDLVTSGFSLCELEDAEARKEHVRRMWDLTRGYLVIVEPGNQEGFQNVLEARELLLADGGNAELIAPCPNSTACPAAHLDEPCNVGQRVGYTAEQSAVLASKTVQRQNYKMQTFSYVIFARGKQPDIGPAIHHETRAWDRLVRPPLKRKGHVVCDVCTKQGCLKRYTISRADGRDELRDARNRYWGDLQPPKGYFNS